MPSSLLIVFVVLVAACSDQIASRQEESERRAVHMDGTAADMAMSKGGVVGSANPVAPESQGQPGFQPPNASQVADSIAAPSLIIRTAQSSIEVQKLEPAIDAVRKLAATAGGYVANSSLQTGENQVRSATLELKIPAANFDKAIAGLKPIGEVETVNTTAEDVSEEYVDVRARVANSRRLEERLIDLLARSTGKLQEVLAVERELARVREEIERYEGRIRFLRTRAAISTLTVTVHEPSPIIGGQPGSNPIFDSFREAWGNFIRFLAGLISSLGVLIPLAILAYAAWLGYNRWGRKADRK